jgi:protein-tyrosine phosphatase
MFAQRSPWRRGRTRTAGVTARDDDRVSIERVLVDTASGRQRLIPFDGTENFRDLGGHPTRFGVSTRWGTLFRSDGLQALSEADVERYRTLGIRVVYDLRRDSERVSRPNRVPSEAHCMMTPVDALGEVAAVRTEVRDRRGGEQMLRAMYAQMAAHSTPVIAGVLTGIADAERLPAVFHCHAGKDRTGLIAALVLEAVGVDRETVLDDYEVSRVLHQDNPQSFTMLVESGMAPEAAAGALGAPRWAMAETLADIDREHGGVEAYLLGRVGLSGDVVDRLRDSLLDT